MVCIYCGGKTKTSNSRGSKRTPSTWRRRQCLQCFAVFTTRETPDYGVSIRVQSDSGGLQPFSRDKLLTSLHSSLSHRRNALDEATALTDTIINKLLTHSRAGVVKRSTVVDQSLSVLKRFDKAAYTYYQAHHS